MSLVIFPPKRIPADEYVHQDESACSFFSLPLSPMGQQRSSSFLLRSSPATLRGIPKHRATPSMFLGAKREELHKGPFCRLCFPFLLSVVSQSRAGWSLNDGSGKKSTEKGGEPTGRREIARVNRGRYFFSDEHGSTRFKSGGLISEPSGSAIARDTRAKYSDDRIEGYVRARSRKLLQIVVNVQDI